MGETAKRVISGLILSAYFIFSFNYDGFYRLPLFLFLISLVGIALYEFYKLASVSPTKRPFKALGITSGLLIVVLTYFYVLPMKYPAQFGFGATGLFKYINAVSLSFHVVAAILFFIMVVAFMGQLKRNQTEDSIYNVGVTLFGVIYVALTSSHLLLLDAMKWGTFYIWLLALMTAMSDTMQYFFGRAFGKHKVGFAVSPKKSWEGYIGGLFGQIIIIQIFYYVADLYYEVPNLSIVELIILSVIIYILSVIGDLSESLLKRDSGVKDSGSVIIGHGGVLDLLDALFLTIPAAYYFIVLRNYLASASF